MASGPVSSALRVRAMRRAVLVFAALLALMATLAPTFALESRSQKDVHKLWEPEEAGIAAGDAALPGPPSDLVDRQLHAAGRKRTRTRTSSTKTKSKTKTKKRTTTTKKKIKTAVGSLPCQGCRTIPC